MKVCFGVISLTLVTQAGVRLTRPKHRFNKNEGKGRYLTMNEKFYAGIRQFVRESVNNGLGYCIIFNGMKDLKDRIKSYLKNEGVKGVKFYTHSKEYDAKGKIDGLVLTVYTDNENNFDLLLGKMKDGYIIWERSLW